MSAAPAPRLSSADFAAYFAREARLHWTIAAGRAGREHADDVLQEAAMIALAKLTAFTPGTNLRAWFAQIVTNVARNARRDAWAEARRSVELATPLPARQPPQCPPVALDGSLDVQQGAFDDRVVAALAALGDDARAALLLRAVHDLPYADIAATLQIPEGTAMSHVHRAKAQLRELLAPSPKPSEAKP